MRSTRAKISDIASSHQPLKASPVPSSSSRPDSGFGPNEPDLCEYLLGMAGQNSVILDSGILCTYRNLYFKSGQNYLISLYIILFQCCQSQLDKVKVGFDLYCYAELSEKELLCLA